MIEFSRKQFEGEAINCGRLVLFSSYCDVFDVVTAVVTALQGKRAIPGKRDGAILDGEIWCALLI
ncbi:MAG: hypothetical protein QNK24_11915 [Desulfuromusa sp.]|nr:hypothetical protein [Desulfuromusa sp.]